MSYNPIYDKGDWKAICDICGGEFKASTLKKRWDGFMVCHKDWETRHPQDFVRGVADLQAPIWTRSEPSDVFVAINYTITVLDDPFFILDVIQRNQFITDTISLTDSSPTFQNENSLSDPVSLGDSVIPQLVIGRVINLYAINTQSLG